MRAYLISATWPVHRLTTLGQVSWLLTGGGSCHLGIFFADCTPEAIAAHSNALVSHKSARGQLDVTFDIFYDSRPIFQSWQNPSYYSKAGTYTLYRLKVDAEKLHDACVRITEMRPKSLWYNRFNALFGGVLPMNAAVVKSGVGGGSCAGVTFRALALALSDDDRALTDDYYVFRTLGVQQVSCGHPFVPRRITGYTPRGALEALQASETLYVGNPIYGFPAAIAGRARRFLVTEER